jgi:hypothetical protein
MRPVTVFVGPLAAASANNIALSQTPGAAGNLILNGSTVVNGIAILDTARRVLITTADTTHTFTIYGTSPTGTLLTESFLIVAGSTYSQLDYQTVTRISISGAATGAVTVGTNGIASSPWVRFDEWAAAQVYVNCDVTGTVNYTVQVTDDDPNSSWRVPPILPQNVTWDPCLDAVLVGASANQQSSTAFGYAPTFARVLLNSSVGAGSVETSFTQFGNVSR